ERRFPVPPAAANGGLACGMSVIIPGAQQPFGVLDAHSHRERKFTRDDLNFLQAVANILATTIGRNQAEEARARLVAILEATTDFVAIAGVDHRVLYLNRAGRALTGLPAAENAAGRTLLDFYPEEGRKALRTEALPAALRKGAWSGETALKGPAGAVAVSQVVLAHRSPAGAVEFFSVIARDISEQQRLEEQFRQAQKMEAVGRLAAGVAHDFNNLLTAILGTTDLMLEDLATDDPDREGLLDIRSASERAAVLTRQLLTFSRQQVVSPQVLRLNDLVLELEKLLRRLLGEDVAIRVAVAPDCGGVKADPGQLEQVIVNLAVNARDAMPNGGRLTLETKNVDLDADYPTDRVTIPAGRYVMLAVTDTGTGMDAPTKARIFEPFFTTKPVGKGTGLGLATVYGAVQQSGGFIWLYSEVGQGTSFKIYLPRVDAGEAQAAAEEAAVVLDGSETVLVAEDEDAVRQIIEEALQARGYRVMVARDGNEALALAGRHTGQIDLLVTDVVMPDMNGRELSQRLTQVRPTIKTLYLSGYTDDAILHHGVLQEGVAFLQKPFSLGVLARKIRDVIEARL
ncbi:MAG: hybrid sensor histidine kinase/response regulator, partial [Gemmatimonadetes bacterium]